MRLSHILLAASLAPGMDAQISTILTRANVAANVSTFADLVRRTGAVNVDTFAGTSFLPTNAAMQQLSNDQPGRYRRIFTNEQFATLHLTHLLQHHMLPGPRLRQNVITAGATWETVAGDTVRGSDVLPLVQTNINTPILVAHKIGTVLLPDFWGRTVQDIVGDYPEATEDDTAFITMFAPPQIDAECPAFWEAHMVVGVAEALPVDPIEEVLTNDGIVYRISQPFDYQPCDSGSLETENPSPATVTDPTAEEEEGQDTEGTVAEVEPSNQDSESETDLNEGTENTQQPAEETVAAPGQPEQNTGETETSVVARSLPIVIGASIAACLLLTGCCLGCYCNLLRSKDDITNYDFSKDEPTPVVVSSKIQNMNYVDEETQKEYEDGEGIMLNPDIQEPSFLTLPTFANPNEPY